MATDEIAEMPRPLPLESIGSDGRTQRTLSATPQERVALARRLELQELASFDAEMTIDRIPGGEILVRGRVVADVVQTCVVSLEPVPGHVDETFEVRYTTRPDDGPADLVIGPDEEFPPEPITGAVLDVGELAAQQLALALDPWPRLPDASIDDGLLRDPARDGPFAALARLRPGQPKKGE